MKKIFLRFLSVLLALQGYAAISFLNIESTHASSYEVPDVIINEVMWMGSTASSGSEDEWIELFNTTDKEVDISGWVLKNVKNSNGDFTFPSNTKIAEKNFLLVGQSGLTSTILSVSLDVEVTSFSLSNPSNCGEIVLEDPTASSPTVDSMGCNLDGSYFGGEKAPNKSLERNIVVEDGLMENSWHTSVGFINLDPSASPNNFATPAFVNDTTAPDKGTVNDGTAADIDWTVGPGMASANWSGFKDDESSSIGLEYSAAFGTTQGGSEVSGGFVPVGTNTSHTFITPYSLLLDVKYYTTVRATNGVGLVSEVSSSDGLVMNIADPDPASSLSVKDVDNDNGGSVFLEWDPSPSKDDITYTVTYKEVGTSTVKSLSANTDTNIVVSGLKNDTNYEFTVIATDFNGQQSSLNPSITGKAKDNLAPVLDATKVVLTQSKPGANDSIVGSSGFSSEPATLTIFDRDPSEPVKVTIASVSTDASLGFDSQILGDNLYGSVWLQLTDDVGNHSQSVEFGNDIVAPNAPTIDRAVSTCRSQSCRVVLDWKDNGPDTDYYQVAYGTGINVQASLPVKSTSLILDIPSDGDLKSFSVKAFDKYGNPSSPSNSFLVSAVPGVITTGRLVNGELVVSTTAVPGSKETVKAAIDTPLAKLVPAAQAAEDTDDAEEVQVASTQDWTRIVSVVILLLVIAGGFYALSRNVQQTELDIPEVPKKEAKKKTNSGKKKTKQTRKRRSGRK